MSDTQETPLIGQVKWFNNKAGYGFITSTDAGETSDIFVHHSAIRVKSEQFKYLVQGEYVQFQKQKTEGADQKHEYCAGEVSGVNGGTLMCETRNAARAASTSRNHEGGDVAGGDGQQRVSNNRTRIRVRGPGPREGEEWMLVKRKARPEQGQGRGGVRRNEQGSNE